MINVNDGNVKLEGTGLELLFDFASIAVSIARTMIGDYGISEKYTREKLHGIVDISMDSFKSDGDAANDFS